MYQDTDNIYKKDVNYKKEFSRLQNIIAIFTITLFTSAQLVTVVCYIVCT